jgi:hypothetical protein
MGRRKGSTGASHVQRLGDGGNVHVLSGEVIDSSICRDEAPWSDGWPIHEYHSVKRPRT